MSSIGGGLLLCACPGPGFTSEAGDGGTSADGGSGCDDSPLTNPSVVSDKCGVFVSPGGDDKTGNGTREEPFATLVKAISVAKTDDRRVFACSGEYAGKVTVTPGVEIFGSRDCAASWERTEKKSVLRAGPGEIPLRLLGSADGGLTLLDGFRFEAADAEAPGGSSIAAVAEEDAMIELDDCELIAGAGRDGDKGMDAPATPFITEQPAMASWGKGTNCADTSIIENKGGEQHLSSCPSPSTDYSVGGAGGSGEVLSGYDGQIGYPKLMGGKGGVKNTLCMSGGAGEPGSEGTDGTKGSAGVGDGVLSPLQGWIGAAGGNGGTGTPGQGGGGGAGQTGNKTTCAGAGGGAGGAGGCGGMGGMGGKAGGSSIALVSIHASVTINNGKLSSANGGKGGRGGNAQPGGAGVNGAPGGTAEGGLVSGCKGGTGGFGGLGGQGGGGAGGHSLSIAFAGTAPGGVYDSTLGSAGTGGKGGLDDFSMNAGADGEAKMVLQIAEVAGD